MYITAILLAVFYFISSCWTQHLNGGEFIRSKPTHIVLAPRRLRAAHMYQLVVGIFNLPYSYLDLHASIRREGDEISSGIERFTRPAFRTMQLQIPDHLLPGNYTLLVEGLSGGGIGTPVFRNETRLDFSPKHVSVFIKTSKLLYQKTSTIKFLVIAVKPNLMPMTGSINIYVKNPAGHLVRRWLDKHVNHGIYRGSFPTGFPVKLGWWTIEVEAWGHRYYGRFKQMNFFYVMWDLNVTMPGYVFDNEFAVAGSIVSKQSHNDMYMTGNGTIDLEVIPPGTNKNISFIHKKLGLDSFKHPRRHSETENGVFLNTCFGEIANKNSKFRNRFLDYLFNDTKPLYIGKTSFIFTMAEIRKHTATLAGTRLVAHVILYDWYSFHYTPATAHSVIMESDVKIRFLGGKVRTFKPGIPMPVYVAVYGADGGHKIGMTGRILYISTTIRTRSGNIRSTAEQNFLVPDDDIVRYSVTPEDDDELISIRAAYRDKSGKVIELTAYRHYTKSDHYLHITTSTEKPRTDHYIVFTIQTSIYIPDIFYQILGNGDILVANTLPMNSRQKTFAVAVSRDMMPSSKIVVFCLLNNGEILADSLSFFVDGITKNKMEVRIDKGKDFTGDNLEVTGLTSPNTFTAFSVCPFFFYAIGGHTFLTQHEVEEDILTYDDHSNTSFKHTWFTDNYGKENVYFNSPSHAVDANTTFVFAGLVVFTDADLTRIPAYKICNETLGYYPCFDGSCFTLDQQCDGVKQCEDGADEMGCQDAEEHIPSRPDIFNSLHILWEQTDLVNWAWEHMYTKPNGRVDFHVSVPLRPFDWVITAVSMSKDFGLAFVIDPPRFSVKRKFYMKVELPGSALRGEQLGVQVSLFNYWNQPLEALITLRGSSQYRFITVNEWGISNSYNPKTLTGDIQTLVYMLPGQRRQIHFPIIPLVRGRVSVTISAVSAIRTQTQTVSVTISMDGVTNVYHTPYLIDLFNKGSEMIPDLDIAVPERFVSPNKRRHLFVPGSQQATVSIVGDVVGAGFDTSYLDAFKLFQLIFGSGEQHIFNFGINCYWLKFLKATNQLSDKTRDHVLTQLSRELDKVLAYRNSDGGQAFSLSNHPSDIWQSALALEVLSSVDRDWESKLYIDTDLVNRLALWMVTQQDQATGAFRATAHPYDPKTKPKLFADDGTPLNISITAHAVIALAKSLEVLSGEAQSQAAMAVTLAGNYLVQHLHLLKDTFQICQTAYALHIANHEERADAFRLMKNIRREIPNIYWSEEAIPSIEMSIVNTIAVLHPRQVAYPQSAGAIQATGYALMVYLRNNHMKEAYSIMRWLNTQRDSDNGFVSTIDTLVATEALMEYAEKNTNRGFQDVLINLICTSTDDWRRTVHLQKHNFSNPDSHSIPIVHGYVRSTASGTGMALIQLTTKVNVEYPQQLRQPHVNGFNLDIIELRFFGRNDSNLHMNICVSWRPTPMNPKSGAVILELDIPTGYHVRKQRLNAFRKLPRLHSQRSRFTKQKVVLYIDYLDAEGACYFFPGERWYPVANVSIQHKIRVYDIYQPGFFNTSLFTTYNLFNHHICQVCGSFQCPYCQYYNAAVYTRYALVQLVILLTVHILALWI